MAKSTPTHSSGQTSVAGGKALLWWVNGIPKWSGKMSNAWSCKQQKAQNPPLQLMCCCQLPGVWPHTTFSRLSHRMRHSEKFSKVPSAHLGLDITLQEKYSFFLTTLKISKSFFLMKYLAKILHPGTVLDTRGASYGWWNIHHNFSISLLSHIQTKVNQSQTLLLPRQKCIYAYGCASTPRKIIAHTSYIKYEIENVYIYIF